MAWMDGLFKLETLLIVEIQNRFTKYEENLGSFSTLFGSAFVYTFLIPMLAAFNTKLHHRALITCMVCDFINLSLKWIISEDRPFSWIHETKTYTSLTIPTLYQTERTCETSPGSPSGHMMLASSFLYLILNEVEEQIQQKLIKWQKFVKLLARVVFGLMLIFTALSRMYFAAHFLHQCIFGIVLGISISRTLIHSNLGRKIENMYKLQWISGACLMTAIVITIFFAHKLISGNPMRSIHMAFKYCTDPLFPKPETTIIFSFIRCLGLIGGILCVAPLYNISRDRKLNYYFSVPLTIILTAFRWYLISQTPRSYKIYVFYVYTIIIYAITEFLFVSAVPKFGGYVVKPKRN